VITMTERCRNCGLEMVPDYKAGCWFHKKSGIETCDLRAELGVLRK